MKIAIKNTNYTFAKATDTITFSGLGTVELEDILLITNVTDNIIIYNFASSTLGGTLTANVLTLTYDCDAMADADELQIFIDVPQLAYDSSNDVTKSIDQSPVWNRYTDPVELISSAFTLPDAGAVADLGSEIDMRGYNNLALYLTIDINSATLPLIRVLHKHESGGTEEYRTVSIAASTSNLSLVEVTDYQLETADALIKINIKTDNTSPYIQIQAASTAGTADGQIDAAYYVRSFSN